jgi:hypothetical protein
LGSVVALYHPYALIAGRSYLLFDVGFAVGTLGLALILGQAVIKHTRTLYRLETQA